MEFRFGIIFITLGLFFILLSSQLNPSPEKYIDDTELPAEPADSPYQTIPFKTLADFPYKKSEPTIPEAVQKLENQQIRIGGFMLPLSFEKGKTNKFVLVGFQAGCCFGASPRLNHWILVQMKENEFVEIVPSFMKCQVYGTLSIGQETGKDQIESFYRLEATIVKPVN